MQRIRSLCRSWGVLAAMGGVGGSAMLGGCQSEPNRQRHGTVWATYSGPTLSAELGVDVRVPAVLAAAESALVQRGYSVVSRRGTEDSGRIEALPPGVGRAGKPGVWEKVWIAARVTSRGTQVKVTAEPWGDEAISRAILDDLLYRLGI